MASVFFGFNKMDDKLKKTAVEAARASGEVLVKYFRSSLDVEVKDELSPLVSKADREAEAAMRAVIMNAFPAHAIKGEELADFIPEGHSVNAITWTLDPLDGTIAYLSGLPTFVVLIGVWLGNRPLLGLIYQPLTKDLWLGDVNGTTLNGTPIRVDDYPNQPFIMATTSPDFLSKRTMGVFDKLRKKAAVTHFGGDGHLYGSLASGRISFIIEEGLNWHDVAALVPIVIGAGGFICSFFGTKIEPNNKNYSIISGTSKVWASEFMTML